MFVPSWFPGASFKRKAKKWGEHLLNQALFPHEYVKREMVFWYLNRCLWHTEYFGMQAKGAALPSFSSIHLEPPISEQQEDDVLWVGSALFQAAADTVRHLTPKNLTLISQQNRPRRLSIPFLP
jgi:hypothetical protein